MDPKNLVAIFCRVAAKILTQIIYHAKLTASQMDETTFMEPQLLSALQSLFDQALEETLHTDLMRKRTQILANFRIQRNISDALERYYALQEIQVDIRTSLEHSFLQLLTITHIIHIYKPVLQIIIQNTLMLPKSLSKSELQELSAQMPATLDMFLTCTMEVYFKERLQQMHTVHELHVKITRKILKAFASSNLFAQCDCNLPGALKDALIFAFTKLDEIFYNQILHPVLDNLFLWSHLENQDSFSEIYNASITRLADTNVRLPAWHVKTQDIEENEIADMRPDQILRYFLTDFETYTERFDIVTLFMQSFSEKYRRCFNGMFGTDTNAYSHLIYNAHITLDATQRAKLSKTNMLIYMHYFDSVKKIASDFARVHFEQYLASQPYEMRGWLIIARRYFIVPLESILQKSMLNGNGLSSIFNWPNKRARSESGEEHTLRPRY